MRTRRRIALGWRARAAFEVAGLVTLALVAPTVADLAGAPDALTQLGLVRSSILGWCVVVVLGSTAVVIAIEVVLDVVSPPLRGGLHVAVLGVLVCTWAVQVARVELGASGVAAAVVAAAVGLAALLVVLQRGRGALVQLAAVSPLLVVLPLLGDDVPTRSDPKERPEHEIVVDAEVPIFVVMFDALSTANVLDGSGHIDRELYPSFARLADDATYYSGFVSVGNQTQHVLGPALTGTERSLATWQAAGRQTPDNLLRSIDRRYDVNAQEVVSFYCGSRCVGGSGEATDLAELLRLGGDLLAQRIAEPQDVDGGANVDEVVVRDRTTSGAAVAMTRASIERLTAERRQLTFIHIMLPHPPYVWTEGCVRYREASGALWDITGQAAADTARQGLLLQARCADVLLGELLDRLEALGIYDDAAVVAFADHGEASIPGEHTRRVSDANAGEVLWTPLLIKGPDQHEAAVSDVLVRSWDLYPTILRMVGAESPWPVDGVAAGDRSATGELVRVFVTDQPGARAPAGGAWIAVDVDRHGPAVRAAGPWGVVGAGDLRLFGFGAHAALVGQRIDEVPAGEAWRGAVEVSGLDSLGSTIGDDLQLVVEGAMDGTRGAAVAVVVDGMVVSVADVDADSGDRTFHLRIPAGRADDGAASLYIVTGSPAAPRLHAVG